MSRGGGKDVVVVTPLAEERSAFIDAIQPSLIDIMSDSESFFGDTNFRIRLEKDFDVKGVIICPDKIGRVEAAVEVTRSCIQYSPKLVILCGRAGGVRYRYNSGSINMELSDVVVCTSLVDLNTRKIVNFGLDETRLKIYKTENRAIRCAKLAESRFNVGSFHGVRGKNSVIPSIFFGPVISGDVVLASESAQAQIAELIFQYNDYFGEFPLAIEMEGIGASVAIETLNRKRFISSNISYIMIRSISDFADSHKKFDEFKSRRSASNNAAMFSIQYIIEYFRRKSVGQSGRL